MSPLLMLLLSPTLRPSQVRRVVDAFDVDGEGGVKLQRIREFTGDRRPVFRGDAWLHLKDVCVWGTTCHGCGMPSAHRVTVALPDAEGQHVVVLGNGEKRQRVQLPEHRQRDDILRQFGELCECLETEGHNAEPDPYEEDEAGRFAKWFTLRPPQACEVSTWSKEQRLNGLRTLQQLSQERRDEAELREMLRHGTPPAAPELWVRFSWRICLSRSACNDMRSSLTVHLRPLSPGGPARRSRK